MKKITLLLITLAIVTTGFSQQISDGFALPYQTDFTLPLKSGVYGGIEPVGKVPDPNHVWNHLFVIRHGNSENNYQLQIASSFAENDKLYFRKIANPSLSSKNPAWIEIASRGANTFTGNQVVIGNLGIGISSPSAYLEVLTPVSTQGIYNTQKWSSGNLGYELKLQTIWNSGGINQEIIQRYNNVDYKSLVFYGGNVGIGISNPNNKLDVNGTIHSKEVKVDMNGWSDFVFKKDYNLPTLAQVEKQINEKGHLENIPNEEDVLKNGINLGDMNAKLLQKIEELTLYMIDQNKNIQNLMEENKKQNEEIKVLKKNALSK
ncbi:hypothetical protein D3C86_1028580 [compost metagenome]